MTSRNRSAFCSNGSPASSTRSTPPGGSHASLARATWSQSSSYQFGIWRCRPSTRERWSRTSPQVVMHHQARRPFLRRHEAGPLHLGAAGHAVEHDGGAEPELGARQGPQQRPPDAAVPARSHAVERVLELGIGAQSAHGPVVAEDGRTQGVPGHLGHGRLAGGRQAGDQDEEHAVVQAAGAEGFSHTDTCCTLSLVKGRRVQLPQRSRSRSPARRAMRSSSAGQT